MKLQGKVAIVTGGGWGLGREISLAFAEEGARIVIAAPVPEQNEGVAMEIENMRRKVLTITTDVTREEQVNNMFQKTFKEFGRIDILVNNAGGPLGTAGIPLWELSLEQWKTVVGVNLTGAFLCSKAVLPAMISQRSGNIINIYSEMKPTPKYATYVAAKSGLKDLSLSLAAEVAPYNIRVNILSPGGAVATHARPPSSRAMARLKPEVIRPSIIYLATEDSAGLTGQCINALEWNEKQGLGTFSDYIQLE